MVAFEQNKGVWLEIDVGPEVDDNKHEPNNAFMAHGKETDVTQLCKAVMAENFPEFMVTMQANVVAYQLPRSA